jgi:hypothetical protein
MIRIIVPAPGWASVFELLSLPLMKIRPLLFLLTCAVSPIFAASSATAPVTDAKPAAEKKPTPAPTVGKPKPYPFDVCLVTDNDLGSMGEETSIVYEGQVIKFCCKPCEEKFLKNPAKYLPKLAPPPEPAKK